MKLPTPTSGNFERCPAGNHLAICYEVIDLGTQTSTYNNEEKRQRKIWIGWETPHETMEDGRPFVIGRRYTLSSHEKSTLRQDLESWKGKAFKDEDFDTFNIEDLIGHACFLNVVHDEKGDRTYANIKAISALPKGTNVPELTNEKCYFSLDPDEYVPETFDSLSDRMKETISASPEYRQVAGTAKLVSVPQGDSGSDEGPFQKF